MGEEEHLAASGDGRGGNYAGPEPLDYFAPDQRGDWHLEETAAMLRIVVHLEGRPPERSAFGPSRVAHIVLVSICAVAAPVVLLSGALRNADPCTTISGCFAVLLCGLVVHGLFVFRHRASSREARERASRGDRSLEVAAKGIRMNQPEPRRLTGPLAAARGVPLVISRESVRWIPAAQVQAVGALMSREAGVGPGTDDHGGWLVIETPYRIFHFYVPAAAGDVERLAAEIRRRLELG